MSQRAHWNWLLIEDTGGRVFGRIWNRLMNWSSFSEKLPSESLLLATQISNFFPEYVDVTALGGSGLFEARNLRGSLKDHAVHREINSTGEMKMCGSNFWPVALQVLAFLPKIQFIFAFVLYKFLWSILIVQATPQGSQAKLEAAPSTRNLSFIIWWLFNVTGVVNLGTGVSDEKSRLTVY